MILYKLSVFKLVLISSFLFIHFSKILTTDASQKEEKGEELFKKSQTQIVVLLIV